MRPLRLLLAVLLGLSFTPRAEAQTTTLRIMPLGDSITDGSSYDSPDGSGGYRGKLYSLLTTEGYSVDYIGSLTINSGLLVQKEHEGHSGWRIDQLDTNMATWLPSTDPGGLLDLVLMHIGTNDFGQNFSTTTAIDRLDGLILKIATLRPNAHIIVTNLMERSGTANTNIIAQFNPFVQDRVNAHALAGRRVSFLDMRSVVPLADMPDSLHPNQTGYDKMANAWFQAIQAVLNVGEPKISSAVGSADRQHVAITFNKPVADSAAAVGNYVANGGLTVSAAVLDATKRVVTLTTSLQTIGTQYTLTVNGVVDRTTPDPLPMAADTTVSFFPARPRGYLNNVPESAGYTLAYSLDIPTSADFKFNSVPYTIDNHNGIGSFSRVAYYLELQQQSGELQYVWASMDAFTGDAGKIGVPTFASGATFQQAVTGLTVVSNVPGMTTGTGLAGNLEFWPTNSTPANALGIAGASDSNYDFGDTQSASGNYGVMQLHNAAAGQTLFAFNNWGGNTTPGNIDLGFGNNPAPVSGGVDWTNAHNAAGYTVKSLQVLVKNSDDLTPPTVVSASSTYGRTTVTVTFSEALAAGSVVAGNFTINGAVVLGATLAANGRDVILTTTTLPAGPVTLTVSGVRDNSPSANLIAVNATIAISPAALPPEIVANAGAAANGYQLVASLNIPTTGNFIAATNPYSFDERSVSGLFSRVAYYLELQAPGQPVQYVWTSMDAFTTSKSKIGIPTPASGAVFQQNVANLDVVSNVAGMVNGAGMSGGNIEFWPTNYSAANALAVPGASDANLDFGDTRSTTGTFGCMQVHNATAAQTVFALNHWGADGLALDVGIGNNAAPVNTGVDWTYAANAASFTRRILHVLVLPIAVPPLPASVAANVPEAAGYQLVYSLDIPATGNLVSGTGFTNYTVNNTADVGTFSRIAYYLELQKTGEAAPRFVWASMDAFTAVASRIGIPTLASGAFFQQYVTKLNVVSNAAGITTGTNIATGNIEFWPSNYSASPTTVPGASTTNYDWGDGGASGTSSAYGSMQVHNYGASQVLFALNNWGAAASSTKLLDLGIGNNPTAGSTGNGGTQQLDYTFTGNAGSYDLKRVLHVFVLPGSETTPPTLTGAKGSTTLNRLVLTFSETVSDSSAAVANFSINGGVTVTGATLLASQREIALTTTAQTPGTLYTVTATGVRDRSGAGNLILPGASATFTAAVAPPILATIPEAAGYNLIYQLAIPNASNYNTTGVPYTIDESKYPQLQPFDRVAYCLELQPTSGSTSWVFTSADAFTAQLGLIGVPAAASGAIFQQNLTNLDVAASAGAPVTTGTGMSGGNIEFWSNNYSAAVGAGVPNASATNFDWGDTRSTTGNYGSMQIHNYNASQTIFAFNNWGSGGGNNDVGIGNDPAPVTAGVDWTFHHNAATFSTKNLYVLVRPGGNSTGTAPLLLSQPGSRTVPPGGSTTFAIAVSGTGPFYYQWRFNGAPINGATNSWLELSALTVGQTGAYDVVVTGPGAASITSPAATLTVAFPNRAPTFNGYAFTAQKDALATVPFASLLTRAADADGDSLTIVPVGTSSQQSGAVGYNANGVTYLPPLGFTGADHFSVTLGDGRGGSVVGALNVTVTGALSNTGIQSGVARRSDGSIDAIFRGTPRASYLIERSIDLTNWTPLRTVVAGDDGLIPVTDSTPPADKAFYRASPL